MQRFHGKNITVPLSAEVHAGMCMFFMQAYSMNFFSAVFLKIRKNSAALIRAKGATKKCKRHFSRKHKENTVNYEQGPLRGILEPLQGFYNHFPRGGALGINLMMLEPWQLVLGGFWNHIMGNQENDPRTPSFWSLSVIKKQSQQLHLSKTRNLTNSIIRLLPLLPC